MGDRVHGLSFDRLNNAWIAQVSGTYDYYVDIKLANIHKGNIQTYCDCPAFDTYGECKHVVAVLLAVQKEIKQNKDNVIDNQNAVKNFFDKVISSQSYSLSNLTEKLPMKVEYELLLEYDQIYIQIRTGIEHCYVVRNLPEFLQEVLANHPYYSTTKFTNEPN